MQFSALTFDQIAMGFMALVALREVLIVVLPRRLAGPSGLLIKTNG